MSEAHKCCGKTWPAGSYRSVGCRNSGKVERNGQWYCGMHDPVAIEAKNEARNKKYSEKWDASHKAQKAAADKRVEEQRRAGCFDDLLEALKKCAAVCAGETMSKSGLVDALEAARAAIAKAQPAAKGV
jgi:hypothetical protein